MSFFSKIKVDVEKFFSSLETSAGKFCAEFVKWFGKAPAALQVFNNFLTELAPVVVGAVAIADPVTEPVVAAALATVETAVAGLAAAATAAVSGTSFLTGLQSFVATIPATLTDLDVKDAALKAKVEWIANFIASEGKVLIPAVENWVEQLSKTASAPEA